MHPVCFFNLAKVVIDMYIRQNMDNKKTSIFVLMDVFFENYRFIRS